MTDPTQSTDAPAAGWRIKLGAVLFVLSVAGPLAALVVIGRLDLPAATLASISGAVLVGAELLGFVAIAVMGKPGFALIKARTLALLRRHAPPATVGRTRYRVGLVLFCLPFLFGWVSIYAYDVIPGYWSNPVPYAIAGDVVLVTSLFVLGGDFWDKLRALFVYDAHVVVRGER